MWSRAKLRHGAQVSFFERSQTVKSNTKETYVRIITSTDGRDGMDFLVIGAWFDNHYTLRRGQLYYNGIPCTLFGTPPWGSPIKLDERIDK
jgi:hypothetical protein